MPAGQTTVILAMDVSRSMCATDIPPNRLLAAEAAAASFIERQGSTTQIGIVAFAGFAELVQPPTTDQEVLLDVVAEPDHRPPDRDRQRDPRIDRCHRRDRRSVAPSPPEGAPPDGRPAARAEGRVRPGDHRVADRRGEQRRARTGRCCRNRPLTRGVRVYTIGFGTEDPGARNPRCGRRSSGGEPDNDPGSGGFGGGGGGGGGAPGVGGGFRRAIDEVTLMAIAEATGGEYYPA